MSEMLFDIAPENAQPTALKLSDAILAGSRLRPQAFGAYFTGSTRADACSCAIGAAYEVTFPGKPLTHDVVVLDFDRSLAAAFPLLKSEKELYCPECAGDEAFHDNLCNVLLHLNDTHRWTRERCADYVKGFEQ